MTRKDKLVPESPDLTAEAGAWLAQLETGKLSREDMSAFREWIQRSPRHYAEIRRLAQLSLEVNVLADMVEPLKQAAARQRVVRRQGQASRPSMARWRWGAVGGVLAAVVAVAAIMQMPPQPTSETAPVYIATTVGQTQDVALDDGSRVKLNTDSQIEVAFVKGRRNVYLDKGEAFFDVAHDAARPFTVYAGDRSVTAVGTAFSVRWVNDELIVTVSEGKVAYGVAPALRNTGAGEKSATRAVPVAASPGAGARTMLGAGQRLEVAPLSRAEVVERLPEGALSRELAWRSGFLDFENEPLSEVVREMQRYTPQKIEIADQSLADIRFGGVFRIGQTDAFIEALELSFGVQVEETSDNRLILKSVN